MNLTKEERINIFASIKNTNSEILSKIENEKKQYIEGFEKLCSGYGCWEQFEKEYILFCSLIITKTMDGSSFTQKIFYENILSSKTVKEIFHIYSIKHEKIENNIFRFSIIKK
jgi:hypothetical protein